MLQIGAHLLHRERRRVRREHALGRDDALELGEDLLLDGHLLEDGLEHEIAAGEDLPLGAARDERGEEARLPLTEPALADQVAELVRDPRSRVVHLLLAEVAKDDGHFEAVEHEQRELACHQSRSDDADLPNATRLDSGNARSALRSPFDEVERVDGGLRLRTGEKVGECLLFGSVALLERPGRGALDQVERAVRRGGGAVELAVEPRPRLPADLGSVREIGCGSTFSGSVLDLLEEHRERLVEELDRLEQCVREAGFERLRRSEHAVLAERVLDDELHRLLRSDELRDELCSTPAGDEAEEDLGAREVADGRRDRAVVAMERDLDASAESRAVDRGERDERQVADPAEELVPGFTSETGSLGRDLAELVDVGADREDEWLAGEQHPAPVARAQPAEDLLERAERLLTEGVRLLPVLAVVHRHESDGAHARVQPLELELGGISHRSAGSPRGSPRPCRARCRAPSSRSASRVGRESHARAGP